MNRFIGTESAGMDGTGDCSQEAETLLQVPDAGAGKRVFVQRLRVEAEALGIGAQSQPDGTSSQDLVPESADEEQEEQPEAAGRQCQQRRRRQRQQRRPSQQQPPPPPSPPRAARRPPPPPRRTHRPGRSQWRPQHLLGQVTPSLRTAPTPLKTLSLSLSLSLKLLGSVCVVPGVLIQHNRPKWIDRTV